MSTKTQIISYHHRAYFFWILLSISFLAMFFYIYALNTTARNIAAKQGAEKETADLTSKLDALEFSYISLRNKITLELAYQYGFTDVKNPIYISREQSSTLSFNSIGR